MKTITLLTACLLSLAAFTQTTTLKGKVTNPEGESAASVNVRIKGTTEGTYTSNNGSFILTTNKALPLTLEFTSTEFNPHELQVSTANEIKAILQPAISVLQDVVVGSNRVPTRILESPVSIEKMGLRTIETTPSASVYDAIANLKGVDFTTSSLTFKTPSTRGFNGSGSARVNQLMDGMDNQAPGMNFFVGNLVGATELDIESIELLPGASSALYGPGGMNGTILVNSKNPFKYQGLSLLVKEGVMNIDKRQRPDVTGYHDISLRWAKALGDRFAFKVGAQYLNAKDWLATDSSNYLRIGDAGKVIPGNRNTDPNYDGVNVYGDETTVDIKPFFPSALQPILPAGPMNVSRTGYAEQDIIDPVAKNLKLSGALHYKLTNNIEASLTGYWAKGSSVYTGADRYALRNVQIGQYKLELRSDKWFLRGYTTQEDAGDSYAATPISRYFNEAWKPSTAWYSTYATTYGGSRLAGLDNAAAHTRARAAADQGRPAPGSDQFNQIFNKLKAIPISKGGGLFLDKTDLWMAEGQYNFRDKVKFAEIVIGGNYKRYVLNSQGTIFIDSAGAIPINEVGGYIQATKKLFNERLTLSASGRVDKNDNFKGKFTPRFTGLIKLAENNNLRLSYQTAYRFPTTQQQYIKLQVGSNIYLIGGLPWIKEYTNPKGGQSYYVENGAPNFNKPYEYKEFKPETCQSFEVGYKGLIQSKLLIDVYGYFSRYQNFLGRIAVVEASTKNIYSIVTNSDSKVKTHGSVLD
jgi:outer membrane receptor protein involved in Fe transport